MSENLYICIEQLQITVDQERALTGFGASWDT